MKLHFIDTGFFKLDGGAMFGVVPKRLWNKLNPADDNNLCTWSMRCLLIETQDRLILVDTGLGNKQDEKFRSHFEPHGQASLLNSLAQKGFQPEDITDVFLTHLHFDHVGGAIKKDDHNSLVTTFPKATYWSNERHFNWALDPNPRERASFLKENILPIQDSGQLKFIEVSDDDVEWIPGIKIRFVYGHTEAMMALFIQKGDQTFVYPADVIPSSHHIGLPYVMAYDIRPLLTLQEKRRILEDAYQEQQYLIFEHDPQIAAVSLTKNDRGRIVKDRILTEEELNQ